MRDVVEQQRRWATGVWVLAGIGMALCVIQYAWNRNWWGDEARLVMNIVTRSARELVGRLDLQQAAPPLFLWIERAAAVVLGPNEMALRLFPLLCGITAIGLITAVAVRGIGEPDQPPHRPTSGGKEIEIEPWHFAGPGAALVAGILAFSDTLLWHSTEAKPYSSDLLASAILWAIALWQTTSGPMRPARWWAWCISAALLVWVSYPIIFVIAGIAAVELWWRLRRAANRNRALLTYILGIALPMLSFACVYWIAIRLQQQTDLYEYWDDRFADWSRPWTVPYWAVDGILSVFNYPIRNTGPVLFALAVVGTIGLWQIGRHKAMLLLVVPLLLTLLAGAAGQYPVPGRRLTFFLTPAAVWLAGLGLNAAIAFFRERWPNRAAPRIALLTVAAAMVGLGAGESLVGVFDPPHRGQPRPVFEALAARHEQGEPIVMYGANVPLEVYAVTAGREDQLQPRLSATHEALIADPAAAERLLHQARDLANGGRFWILFEYSREETRDRYLAAIAAAAPEAQPVVEIEGGYLAAAGQPE